MIYDDVETRFIFAIDLLVSIMFIVQTYVDFTNHQEEPHR